MEHDFNKVPGYQSGHNAGTSSTWKELLPEALPTYVKVIESELKWLDYIINSRLSDVVEEVPIAEQLPKFNDTTTPYVDFIRSNELGVADRVLLLVALAYRFDRQLFADKVRHEDPSQTNEFIKKLGLAFNHQTNFYHPTVRTVAKILAGNDHQEEIAYLFHFDQNSRLIKEKVIVLESITDKHDSVHNMIISLDPAYLSHFYYGAEFRLDQLQDFMADKLETTKTFEDLVLNRETAKSMMPLIDYIKTKDKFFGQTATGQKIKEGFVVMFHGYPGTGKTYTASVLGNQYNLPVYHVDLAGLVSKYIGETSKNLKNIFDRLQNEDCILFFDEADSVFGKRTQVKESKDRYSNQEVSYLLQAIEKFKGIVILSTNYSDNIDMAFRRRIHVMVDFRPPDEGARLKLWKYYFPKEDFTYEPANLLEKLAKKYSVTGANIANTVKLVCLEAGNNGDNVVLEEMMDRHLSAEYYKDGRNFNDPHRFSWEKMQGMN